MAETGKEKRLSGRVAINLPASFSSQKRRRPGRTLVGRTLDLGEGGLKISLKKAGSLKVDEPVYLRIDTAEPEGFIAVQGKIRWTRQSAESPNEWEVGVQLTGLDLARWVIWLEAMTRQPKAP